MEFASLTRIGLHTFGRHCASICNLSTFVAIFFLAWSIALAYFTYGVYKDYPRYKHSWQYGLDISRSLFTSGKVTKSTYWHNEKMVFVHMPTKKPFGYKSFLHSPKLQMYLPPSTSQFAPSFTMLWGPMGPFMFSWA